MDDTKYFVTQDELSEWCGHKKRGHIQRWLEENRINYFCGNKKRLCTTTEAIERALGKGILPLPEEINFYEHGTIT